MSIGQKLEPHDWLLPLFLCTICIGVKHCCLLTFPFMLFVFKTWSCAAISISSVSFFNNLVFSQFQFSWLLTSSVFLINWMLWLFHEVLPSFQRLSFLVFPSPWIPSFSTVFSSGTSLHRPTTNWSTVYRINKEICFFTTMKKRLYIMYIKN